MADLIPANTDHADNVNSGFTQYRESQSAQSAIQRLEEATGAPDEHAGDPTQASIAGPASPKGGTTAGSVVKDVARGAVEAPAQVLGGARDAVQETVNMSGSLWKWFQKQTGASGLVYHEGKGLAFTKATDHEAPQLPEIHKPESVTGGIVRSISQFMTGVAGAGKFIKVPEMSGKVANAAGAMLKGAVADFTVFDPAEKNLSSLVQEYPVLQNPVNEYLAGDPNDHELDRRAKRAMEGAGLGVIADGFIASLGLLRQARIAKATAGDPNAVKGTAVVPYEAKDILALGDAESKSFFYKKKDRRGIDNPEDKVKAGEAAVGQRAADVRQGTRLPDPNADDVYINWSRIESGDDVKSLIQKMANEFRSDIGKEQRGVRTWQETTIGAKKLDAWNILMKRKTGEPLNAEQSLAARQLWVTSGENLKMVAQNAAANPSEMNIYAFRKMMAIHYAVQKEVIGARTETARALNAWAIPAGPKGQYSKTIQTLIEQSGGAELNQDMARRFAMLASADMPTAVEQFVERGLFANTRDAVRQVWVNAMLTNPTSHTANFGSGFLTATSHVYEREGAALVSRMLGTEEGVDMAETLALVNGYISAGKEALGVGAKKTIGPSGEALYENAKPWVPPGLDVNRKIEAQHQAFRAMSPNADGGLGSFLDGVDYVTTTPGRMMGHGDEFWKGLVYRAELHAQGARQASQDLAAGRITADQLRERAKFLVDNPPEHIHMAAVDQALIQTFNSKPAALANRIMSGVQDIPLLGVMLIPFKNTPINIATYAFERTPLAPLIKTWRADVTAGGARADAAMARTAIGSTIMMSFIDMAMQGQITGSGPSEPGEMQNWQRQGNQAFSVKVNGKNYAYSRLDPLGTVMGIAGGIGEAMMNMDPNDTETYAEVEKAYVTAMFSISEVAMSKNFMVGISKFFDANSDSKRSGEAYWKQLSGTVVPAGVAMTAKQVDPYLRIAQDSVDNLKRRIPGQGKDLPLYRDLWGRKMDFRSGLGQFYDVVSPVYVKKDSVEPIDGELKRLGYFPKMPDRKTEYNGVTIDFNKFGKEYSEFVFQSGNGLKLPQYDNKGAMDFLNALVSGKSQFSQVYNLYSDGPDGGKAQYIQSILNTYRVAAKQSVVEGSPKLKAEYDSKYNPMGKKLSPAVTGAVGGVRG